MWKTIVKFFRKALRMKYYLVTIDTTNRPSAKGFRPGIQNFYICIAPGEPEAKNLVLSTFRSNPNLLNQLIACTNAAELDSITRLLSPQQALWSYIPIGGIRAPGQQKLIPNPDSLVNQNPQIHQKGDYSPSVKPIAPPKTYEAQVALDAQAAAALAPQAKVGGDAIDQLLNDPRFKEALLAKLGVGPALNGSQPTLDPEATLRFNDEGAPYDDNLAALPPDADVAPAPVRHQQGPPPKQGLPTTVKGPIPGEIEPDAVAMARLRANIKPINLETID